MESGGNIEIFGLDTPIGVGGVGGSGTRLIAAILQELGFYLGRDLNEPLDNLWFTLLFKRQAALDWSYTEFARVLEIFKKAMCGGGELLPEEIRVIEGCGRFRPAATRCRLAVASSSVFGPRVLGGIPWKFPVGLEGAKHTCGASSA